MPTTIAVLTERTGIANLWRNGRRKKDGYRNYYVVRFRITYDDMLRYTLTPQAPCTGEPITYDSLEHLKIFWEPWKGEVDYERKYE